MSNTSHTLRAARHQQQGLHHLFQTTAQRDPLHPLTTNHIVFDDVVNLLLERFLPSGSLEKVPTGPERLLIHTSEEDDNEKVDVGGEEEKERRKRLDLEDRKIEERQRHANKAMLLHFNQLPPSHMAAEHPEGRRRHES